MAIGRDEFPMRLRYGMRHTWRCECSDCVAAFRTHQRRYGDCACEDCANSRLWADQKREKERVDNLSPRKRRELAAKIHRHGPKCNFGHDCNSTNPVWETQEKEVKTVATINLCDRCESMAKSPAMGLVVIVPETAGPENVYADAVHTTDRNTVRKDLCPACVGELMEWVDATPGPREKAYSRPWKPAPKPAAPTSSAELFALAIEASKREMESGEVSE